MNPRWVRVMTISLDREVLISLTGSRVRDHGARVIFMFATLSVVLEDHLPPRTRLSDWLGYLPEALSLQHRWNPAPE
jgi:hypothetical protein